MADTLELEIVTPDKLLVRGRVDEVQIPGKKGYLGVLPGHAPLITELMIGEISYRQGATTYYLAVAWGFAEVLSDKVTILADTAERAEDIDVERAREAKARADEALQHPKPDLDIDAVLYAQRRAAVRLEVAARAGRAPATAAH
jgi:F-type H+-transporting ATPase subunit epsilon